MSKVSLATEIGGLNGANPLKLSMPVMIAPMSYGALSASTKRAVGLASTLSGIAENTGEGEMSDAQRGAASQLIFQMLGGRLGWNIHGAKLVGLGVNAIGYGVAVALALGGETTETGMRFAPDRNEEERTDAVVNILKANAGEVSMMARCPGKTRLHNVEPEDLRSATRATAAATGIPLAGTRAA